MMGSSMSGRFATWCLVLVSSAACVRSDATRPTSDATAAEFDAPGGSDALVTASRFAIYDDTAEADASAWAKGLDLIQAALEGAGVTVARIDRQALDTDAESLEGFDGIVFGGGFAYPGYTLGIDAEGKQRLRDFVGGGGVFVGVCAGAYFACDELLYEGETIGDESGYDLDLYDGRCEGPVAAVAHYPDWALAQIELPEHPSHASFGESLTNAVWYAGGPFFPDVDAGVTVLARYADSGIEQQGEPAVIARTVGEGTVLLWGPHFEVTDAGASETNPALFAATVRWFAD